MSKSNDAENDKDCLNLCPALAIPGFLQDGSVRTVANDSPSRLGGSSQAVPAENQPATLMVEYQRDCVTQRDRRTAKWARS